MSNGGEFIKNLNLNAPLPIEEIKMFEKTTGIMLPKDYTEFLMTGNGGEGFIGDNAYIILWKLNELIELNSAYNVKDYAPGLLLFGSNGGGDAYAFDMRNKPLTIIRVPFIGMDLKEVEYLSSSFNGFLEKLSKDEYDY